MPRAILWTPGGGSGRQWLDDPELCRGEAISSVKSLRTRAVAYLEALKETAVA